MNNNLETIIERKSFILGMITAFGECVAGECKKAALSPPFYPDDYFDLLNDVEIIIKELGLKLWYEENLDISLNERVNWFVIYKFPEVLEEYKDLRNKGYNPVLHFNEFSNLLSYGIVYGENAEKVAPKIREKVQAMDIVSRILLKPGDWPIEGNK